MTGVIQISVTTADLEEAQLIADHLVAQRLAACVQISGPIESRYWWNGQVEQSTEWMCTVKTRERLFGRVEQVIRRLHSYEEPEILAVTVVAGNQGYLDWVAANVQSNEE